MSTVHVALCSESDWNKDQKAVMDALRTFDNIQKEGAGSVKYITRRTVTAGDNLSVSTAKSVSLSMVVNAEVTYALQIYKTCF